MLNFSSLFHSTSSLHHIEIKVPLVLYKKGCIIYDVSKFPVFLGSEQTVSDSADKTVNTANQRSSKEKVADNNDDQSDAESEDVQSESPAAEEEQKNKKPETSSRTHEDVPVKPSPPIKYDLREVFYMVGTRCSEALWYKHLPDVQSYRE